MKVTRLDDVEARPRRVAVGEFDGVHLGHREVIRDADTVLTFEPHPLAVIRPEAAPKLLTTLDRKAELLDGLGVAELVVIEFDRAFAQRSAQEFIDRVLNGALGATRVSVGQNFRFGHKAQGDPELLARQQAFDTRVTPLVEVDQEIVSSTLIRHLIQLGDVERAGRLLGDPFQLRGTVVIGDRRGRTLGFPTANLVPDEALVYPGHGVYAAYANEVAAAVSVGVRPTFGTGRAVLVEAFLIDFDGDLYGTELRLDFVARLRGERAFATVEALVEQMNEDVAAAATVTRRS
ncbi:MAG TPA: bifunctional riboflavin kinase/FAD synthetase [Solirubrobacteraceae bacterium]|nr:bifunctional riboflavin kinase/FAD synthetase [Solirubrobacteraceae bacterium]